MPGYWLFLLLFGVSSRPRISVSFIFSITPIVSRFVLVLVFRVLLFVGQRDRSSSFARSFSSLRLVKLFIFFHRLPNNLLPTLNTAGRESGQFAVVAVGFAVAVGLGLPAVAGLVVAAVVAGYHPRLCCAGNHKIRLFGSPEQTSGNRKGGSFGE